MKVTVCELPNDPAPLIQAWEGLVGHTHARESDVVLLPEMPFHPWPAWTKDVDPTEWDVAVAAHDAWIGRLDELGAPIVIGSRPVVEDGRRLNEAFVWSDGEYRGGHRKWYLPNEDGFWEATWYDRGDTDFSTTPTRHGPVGLLICTEVWFTRHARTQGQEGAWLIANPRATEYASREKWLAGGITAAVMAGAFCLSSNRSGLDGTGIHWGGYGWVVDPDGKVLATTSEDEPFATVDIDLLDAERAKVTYPRYVED